MHSVGDIVVDTDSDENNEADTSKYLSFCMAILKTTILIADNFFYHYVNDCIYLDILKKKYFKSQYSLFLLESEAEKVT